MRQPTLISICYHNLGKTI